MPDSFAQTPDGLLLIANGWNPMLRWDSLRSQAEPAGVLPPTTAPTINTPLPLGGDAAAPGQYYAYVRFVDRYGNFSNLSPVSALSTPVQSPGGTPTYKSGKYVLQSRAIYTVGSDVLHSPNHGLATGDTVYILAASAAPIVGGTIIMLGLLKVTVIDVTTFQLNLPVIAEVEGKTDAATLNQIIFNIPGLWAGQTFPISDAGPHGVWLQVTPVTGSVAPVLAYYSDVPLPTEPKVMRRQILRNTSGQATTFYVDVDTDDLTSTTFSSTRDDANLAAQASFSLFDEQLNYQGDFFHVPPDHKSVLAFFLGRMYSMVDIEYSEGCIAVEHGATTIQGIGTEWANWPVNEQLFSRFLYVQGGPKEPVQIRSEDPETHAPSTLVPHVNTVTQVATLLTPYLGPTDPFALYTIRPAPAERKLVYYSQAGFPEAVPVTNAFAVPEDGDQLVGGMAKGSFIYILERQKIYRLTSQTDPGIDGFLFLAANRGCINNRCWVLVDDLVYMLDQAGIYSFTGGTAKSLTESIQDIFETYATPDNTVRINWQAAASFHAVNYPAQEVVRWFVALSGDRFPRHALCYAYRTEHWWIEEFSFPITSSCLGYMNGKPQVFLGTLGNKVLAYGQGCLDGPDASTGLVRGTVTSAGPVSLTDILAVWPASGVVGYPVVIVSGRGKGQVRLVSEQSGTTLRLDQPWLVRPDTTSVYQLGGIPFTWRTGWFRWADEEKENPRRLEIVFDPVEHSCFLDARFYLDRASTPLVWDATYTSEQANQFSSTHGSADLVADLSKASGFVQKRMDGWREYNVDGRRFFQLELAGVANEDQVTIYQAFVDGAS